MENLSTPNGKLECANVLSNMKEALKGAGLRTSLETWKYFGLLCPSFNFTRYLNTSLHLSIRILVPASMSPFSGVNLGLGSDLSVDEKEGFPPQSPNSDNSK